MEVGGNWVDGTGVGDGFVPHRLLPQSSTLVPIVTCILPYSFSNVLQQDRSPALYGGITPLRPARLI